MDFARVFPSGPAAPRQARRALDELYGVVPPALLADVRVIVGEFVTNSVKHSGGVEGDPITLRVECSMGRVRIEVEDGGPGFSPVFPAPDASSESGWGLFLVDRLSDRWGTAVEGRVWAEVDLPEGWPVGS